MQQWKKDRTFVSCRKKISINHAEQAVLGMLLAVFVLLFVMQGYRVSGGCMQPHLYTGNRILTYKLAYTLQRPRRGDVVVFHYPPDPRQTFVKRIIGLPGETVSMQSGRIYIDGRAMADPYDVFPAHGNMAPQTVKPDSYFVMGDNRDNSDDSRFWGDLPRSDIIGRAIACYWPLHSWEAL